MECSRAIEKIATALSEYFKKRAPQAAEYIEITGQPEVKVALRAIALYYERDEEALYLEDLIEALGSRKVFEYLRDNVGWRLVEIEGEKYVAIPSVDYLRYINMPPELFKNLLEKYCSQ
ncbi:MAG: hypothetical protein RMH84_00190 [Sulfolobales archaeon]|nr:hypothetical protein [Sulfolobales archaeon]MCX8208309.1 hypothetical protein [Sulfolobales archaeon]MDW8010007.1 hypothetical protein [Sulfolobales archaeon]